MYLCIQHFVVDLHQETKQIPRAMITIEEQKMYPKVMIAAYFPNGADKRDKFLESYRIETIVNDSRSESRYYENLCHESNISLMVKLPNGVIK